MPAIAKLIPYDDLLSKVQVQKAATPVSAATTLDRASDNFACMRPNAVVLEKSSAEESDINAQRIAALQSVVARLGETQEFSEDDGSESEDGSVGD